MEWLIAYVMANLTSRHRPLEQQIGSDIIMNLQICIH